MNEKFKNVEIRLENIKYTNDNKYLSYYYSKKFLNSIITFQHGVFCKNSNGLVTTSANLGVVNLVDNIFKIGIRSSKKIETDNILKYLNNYAKQNNYKVTILSSQPGFETKEDSTLIKKLIQAYHNSIKDNNLVIKPSHVTLECGFFTNKIPNLNVAIISPQIIDAHTTMERVEIDSIHECDMWIYEFLKMI